MMNVGNILMLQKYLAKPTQHQNDHTAHFALDHFENAVRLNPLSGKYE